MTKAIVIAVLVATGLGYWYWVTTPEGYEV